MLFHQIGLGFMFIHVVYLSAVPILLDEKKKTSTALSTHYEDETTSSSSSEPPEPWEVNQHLTNRYIEGVHVFCRLLTARLHLRSCRNPLIYRLSPFISNRNVNCSQFGSTLWQSGL